MLDLTFDPYSQWREAIVPSSSADSVVYKRRFVGRASTSG